VAQQTLISVTSGVGKFDGRKAVSIREACSVLGVSRNFLLAQIRLGNLETKKRGRRVFITVTALDAFLADA
jgi:excisionase family DNA binding protein